VYTKKTLKSEFEFLYCIFLNTLHTPFLGAEPPIKNWGEQLIYAQTLVTLLYFAIWRSAYCLSIPKRKQLCGVLYPLSPNMNTKGMCPRSFKVSMKPCILKELTCMWIKNTWACISHMLMDKM
jgi:hypothetical protein